MDDVSLRLTREQGAEFPLHFETDQSLCLLKTIFSWGVRHDCQDDHDEKAIAGDEVAPSGTAPHV